MEQIQIDTQNQQQVLAYELIANTNSSFFLTGRAGTGKTTFLRNVQKMVNKQLSHWHQLEWQQFRLVEKHYTPSSDFRWRFVHQEHVEN